MLDTDFHNYVPLSLLQRRIPVFLIHVNTEDVVPSTATPTIDAIVIKDGQGESATRVRFFTPVS